MKYGYVRISTKEQNEGRQLVAMESHAIPKENIYVEKQSGKDFERPKYRKLLRQLKPNDLLIIQSIDRLGRDYAEIIEQWRIITKKKGTNIMVLDMPLLDTTYGGGLLRTFIADLVLQVMSFCAQLEREKMLERQAGGIAVAKANGIKLGRCSREFPDDFAEHYKSWKRGEINVKRLARHCGFSVSGFYKKRNQLRARGEWLFD